MMGCSWTHDILPVLVREPEDQICIEFGACLLSGGEALYERNNVPSDIVDLMRVNREGTLRQRALQGL